jgi:solute carrier family 12 (sodium/potassium/chloride transporter), member 2
MSPRDPQPPAGPPGAVPPPVGASAGATLGSTSLVLPAHGRLGTFAGVFTPVVLSILGVVMFMRAGTVVGHAGLWMALLILLVAKAITTFTTLSLSAIATNLDVRVGGVYYMVSRVLGPDFGGSIGITLYLALAVNVAFYTIGFSEAFFTIVAHASPRAAAVATDLYVPQLLSTGVVVGLFVLTHRGTAQAIKAQNIVLGVLLLSVASVLVGGLIEFEPSTFAANRGADPTSRVGFWTAFAIFFPAAAGISAGANMSGDLKDPARSIPRGTILAIAFTGAIYAAQLVLSAGATSRSRLQTNAFDALQDMSLWGPLVVLGVFAASLSAALVSLLGAPRILQALGQDRLFKLLEPFGQGSGPTNEPRRATIATFVIALVVIWIADLDAVARVVSMFFLIAYGMINTSAFVESKSANPSFRPRFRAFHWSLALVGAIGCLVAMIKIDETYAVIALAITALVYFYLRNRDIKASWGDAKQGYVFARARDDLLYLGSAKPHPKNWRPIVAAVGPDPLHEPRLVQVGAWLECRRGLYTVAQIHRASEPWLADRLRAREGRRAELRRHLASLDIVGFPEVIEVDDYPQGLIAFLQSYAIEGVRPNTVLVSIPPRSDLEGRQRLLHTEAILRAFDFNLVLLKPGEFVFEKPERTIDLWWRGDRNGSLMVLLAYLVTLDRSWRAAKLRICQAVADADAAVAARKHLQELLSHARIDAEIFVFEARSHPHEFIPEHSGATADIVMLGLSAVDVDAFPEYLAAMEPMLERLPTTLLVRSNGQADLVA